MIEHPDDGLSFSALRGEGLVLEYFRVWGLGFTVWGLGLWV